MTKPWRVQTHYERIEGSNQYLNLRLGRGVFVLSAEDGNVYIKHTNNDDFNINDADVIFRDTKSLLRIENKNIAVYIPLGSTLRYVKIVP